MAGIYSYQDFENEANRLGLLGQFSDADLRLAKQNADAGMSILKFKQDYANATTDEARALANAGANNVRSSYGGYTGGANGGSFALNPLSPASFTRQTEPEENNPYTARKSEMLDAVLNRDQFSYDYKTDPNYQAYAKMYAREGKRATEDALGSMAAMTGGMPSTAAATAASQAGDYYAAQMADKMPELYKDAYNRYLQEYQMQMNDLDAVRTAEQDEYTRYLNDRQQRNLEDSFNYGQYLDEIANQTQLRQERTAQAQQDHDNAMQLLQLMGYAPEDAAKILGIESGAPTLAGLERNDAQAQQAWANRYNIANLGGSYGDYSGLEAMGITPNAQNLLELSLANAGRTQPVGSGTTTPTRQPTKEPDNGPDDGPDDEPISAEAIKTIRDYYGGMTLTEEVWEGLKKENDGYTDEKLIAAGFQKEEKPRGGTSSINTVSYNENDGSFTWFGKRYKNAQELEKDLNAYISRGVVTPKIEAAIKEQLSQLGFNAG